jgi:sugar phosphate isomerase/epimerase
MTTRRNFLRAGLAVAATGAVSGTLRLAAQGLRIPLGLQLYSVRELLPVHYEEILKMIGSLGYREVEAAGFFDRKVGEVKRAMDDARLACVSAHYGHGLLTQKFNEILAFNKELGVKTLICSSPGHRIPSSQSNQDIYSLDDWHFMADQLNSFGEKVRAAGLNFGYHNHFKEFIQTEGVVPYRELLRRTDPALVTMEMDCGWVVAAGASPVDYLREYPSRITMLHVKDFVKPATPLENPDAYTVTELGRGYIDYRPIFREAAKTANLKHIFAEQEAFDIPVKASLAEDARYLHRLLG